MIAGWIFVVVWLIGVVIYALLSWMMLGLLGTEDPIILKGVGVFFFSSSIMCGIVMLIFYGLDHALM